MHMTKTATAQKDLTLKCLFFPGGARSPLFCVLSKIFHSYSGKCISIIFLLFYSDTAHYIPCSATCQFHGIYLTYSFYEYIKSIRLLVTAAEYSSAWRYLILCIWLLIHGHLGYFQSLTKGHLRYFQALLLQYSPWTSALRHASQGWVRRWRRLGPRAGTFVNGMYTACWPSNGTALIVAPTNHKRDCLSPQPRLDY